jgi:hypothetical protein
MLHFFEPLLLRQLSLNFSNYHYPVFALAKDLGKTQATSESVVFALGLARDPVIQIMANGQNETRYPFYKTRYNNAAEGVSLTCLCLYSNH